MLENSIWKSLPPIVCTGRLQWNQPKEIFITAHNFATYLHNSALPGRSFIWEVRDFYRNSWKMWLLTFEFRLTGIQPVTQSYIRRQAIIWTNAGMLLISLLGTNFGEILFEIWISPFKKMRLKMSSREWRPFCLGLNVLTHVYKRSYYFVSVIICGLRCNIFCNLYTLRSDTAGTHHITSIIMMAADVLAPNRRQATSNHHADSSATAGYNNSHTPYDATFISQSLTHWGRDKMDAISQTTFWSAFSWMKMFEFRLKFHWSLFLRVQLTKIQHWFRKLLGAGQATSHYRKQWWLIYWRIYASLGLNVF